VEQAGVEAVEDAGRQAREKLAREPKVTVSE